MMHHHQNAYAQQQYQHQHQMMQQTHPNQHQQQQQMILLQQQQQQQQQQQLQHQQQPQHQMQTSPAMIKLGKRPIAPAPLPTEHNQLNRVSSTMTNSKKAKMTYAHMAYASTQPASVQRRNARERNRVKQVNLGFANLRQHIPSDAVQVLAQASGGASAGRGASKKLSKVDTLRMAVEYIRRLQGMLDENELDALSASSSSTSSSLSNNSYYSPSPVQYSALPPPPCSESSASPTPSYSSDNSSIGNGNFNNIQTPVYDYPVFSGYNPEDEEILEAISHWTQQ